MGATAADAAVGDAAAAGAVACGEAAASDEGFTLSTPEELGDGPGRRAGGAAVGVGCLGPLTAPPALAAAAGLPRRRLTEEEVSLLVGPTDAALLGCMPRSLADRYAAHLQQADLRRQDAERRAAALEAHMVAATPPSAVPPLPTTQPQSRALLPAASWRRWAVALAGSAGVGLLQLAVLLLGLAAAAGEAGVAPALVAAAIAAAPPPPPLWPLLSFGRGTATVAEAVEGGGCRPGDLAQSEAEAEDAVDFAHRDFEGYQKMVAAMDDWISVTRSQGLWNGRPNLLRCVHETQAGYRAALGSLRGSLLADRARSAELRSPAGRALLRRRRREDLRVWALAQRGGR